MKKRLLVVLMAAAMTLSLAACGSSDSGSSDGKESTSVSDESGDVYNIGICQLVQHEALDAATEGFQDALVEKLGKDKVNFDVQNASGDSATCATIVNQFVSDGDDLIMANATASLQAAAANTEVINNTCLPAGVPIIAGEQGICAGCGVATLSISYYDLGYKTGEMAAEILAEGADISTMAIEYAPNVTKQYNEANCTELDVTPPEGYEPIAADDAE